MITLLAINTLWVATGPIGGQKLWGRQIEHQEDAELNGSNSEPVSEVRASQNSVNNLPWPRPCPDHAHALTTSTQGRTHNMRHMSVSNVKILLEHAIRELYRRQGHVNTKWKPRFSKGPNTQTRLWVVGQSGSSVTWVCSVCAVRSAIIKAVGDLFRR